MKILKYAKKKGDGIGYKFLIVSLIIVMFVIFIIGLQIGRVVEKTNSEKRRVKVVSKPMEEDLSSQIRGDIENMRYRETVIPEKITESKPDSKVREKKVAKKDDLSKGREKKGLLLQVGVFSVRENAKKLVASLEKKGISARIERAETGSGKSFNRVISGPYISRNEAQIAASKIKKITGIEPIILKRKK